MPRRDNLWSSCSFCNPEAASPMTCGDKLWSFRTPFRHSETIVSDCTQRQIMVILRLLSSRGGEPDDMQRQIMVIPLLFAIRRRSSPTLRRYKLWSFCTFCHPDAVSPITCRDKLLSFRTPFAIQIRSCPTARKDKLWSFCAFCHPEAVSPMTCRYKL